MLFSLFSFHFLSCHPNFEILRSKYILCSSVKSNKNKEMATIYVEPWIVAANIIHQFPVMLDRVVLGVYNSIQKSYLKEALSK